MTEFLGRIDNLSFAIDALNVWMRAVRIIKAETGIEAEDEPEKALIAAKAKLAELEKKKPQ